MKTKIIVSIIVISVVLVGYFLIKSYFCTLGCKHCTRISESKKESKKNGFYLAEYKQVGPNIKLQNYAEEIKFKTIWVESQWFNDSKSCFSKKLESREGYSIFFEYEKPRNKNTPYTFKPVLDVEVDNVEVQNARIELLLTDLPDTLKLQVFEKNPNEKGWTNKIETETITFVKV